jgi:hypothetical protein
VQRLQAVFNDADIVAHAFQQRADDDLVGAHVLRAQHAQAVGVVLLARQRGRIDGRRLPSCSGTVKLKVEPAPTRLSAAIEPPISSTSSLQMARPRPVPP